MGKKRGMFLFRENIIEIFEYSKYLWFGLIGIVRLVFVFSFEVLFADIEFC